MWLLYVPLSGSNNHPEKDYSQKHDRITIHAFVELWLEPLQWLAEFKRTYRQALPKSHKLPPQCFVSSVVLVPTKCVITVNDEGEELDDNLPVICGIRKPLPKRRIMFGKNESIPYSWPWHAGLYFSGFGAYPFCGATLISPKWVLTAAHCIEALFNCSSLQLGTLLDMTEQTEKKLVVRVGDHQHTKKTSYTGTFSVHKVILHPNYNLGQTKLGFDVALLKIRKRIKRMVHVQFACLPESFTSIEVGDFCYFAGWGRVVDYLSKGLRKKTSKLMEARVPIVSIKDCQEEQPTVDNLRQVCTDATFGAACTGDSGGGLHCIDGNGRWIVYGIISFGNYTCIQHYTVYTLAGRVTEWIKGIVRNN